MCALINGSRLLVFSYITAPQESLDIDTEIFILYGQTTSGDDDIKHARCREVETRGGVGSSLMTEQRC